MEGVQDGVTTVDPQGYCWLDCPVSMAFRSSSERYPALWAASFINHLGVLTVNLDDRNVFFFSYTRICRTLDVYLHSKGTMRTRKTVSEYGTNADLATHQFRIRCAQRVEREYWTALLQNCMCTYWLALLQTVDYSVMSKPCWFRDCAPSQRIKVSGVIQSVDAQ